MIPLVNRIFDVPTLIVCLSAAGVATLVRILVGARKSQPGGAVASAAIETLLLTFAGGFLAHTFIALLLRAADDSLAASIALSVGFTSIVGIPASIATAIVDATGGTFPIQDVLLWTVTVVGIVIGAMDGGFGIHAPVVGHLFIFTLDVTIGLPGATIACLFHLVNTFFNSHERDPRSLHGVHRYSRGFAFRRGFITTEGNVMSNLTTGPGSPVHRHELFHVWQNRLLGPVFIVSHITWMFVFGILLSWIGALARKTSWGDAITKYAYFNNPYEVMAYTQNPAGREHDGTTLLWSGGVAVLVSIAYFAAFLPLAGWICYEVWSGAW